MKINQELFKELCELYEVEFSEQYKKVMLEDENGEMRELIPEDIKEIISPYIEVIPYTVRQREFCLEEQLFFEASEELLIAA
ncbi:MAG: hypothetical protein IJV50_08075 [Lachnospiraceae bacterium]|nr:hypothetical protein [Lachnospiraceae bacterium]